MSVGGSANAGLAEGGVGGHAGGGLSQQSEISLRQQVSTSETSTLQRFTGGDPGLGSFEDGNTDSLKQWASTVAENPAPISYVLIE